jgi:hypothetical protein
MDKTFEIGDILAAMDAWELSRREFLSNLARAKQPEPSPEAMQNYRDVFIESWLLGRKSK